MGDIIIITNVAEKANQCLSALLGKNKRIYKREMEEVMEALVHAP
jgi:hypothetical protein